MASVLAFVYQVLLQPLASLLLFITPFSLQSRFQRLLSVGRQNSNLIVGRLLSDLSPHIPHTDLRGANAIVTGANSGIGLQVALELTRRGANVVIACRSLERGETAKRHILWNFPDAGGRVAVSRLDTSDLETVKEFCVKWVELQSSIVSPGSSHAVAVGAKKLDILFHNAGISHPPSSSPGGGLTPDGIELVYATNFLGSFLLTYLLEPYLSDKARVIFTTSTGQLFANFKEEFSLGPVRGVVEPGFHSPHSRLPVLGWEYQNEKPSARYGMTKGMQCVLARALQERWDRAASQEEQPRVKDRTNAMVGGDRGEGVLKKRTAHAFTPGFTATPIFDKFEATSLVKGLFLDPIFALLKVSTVLATDVDQGAATGVWLACTDDHEVTRVGGGYWDRMRREFSVADAMSETMLQRLWTRWERDSGVEWA